MVSLTKDNHVKISEFQICLRMDFCHFNYDTDTLVKIGAKPKIIMKKQMSSNYLFISILKLVVSATVQKPKLLTFLHLRMISLYIDSGKKYYGTYMKLCRSHRAHRNACSWECKYIPCTNLDLCRTEIGPLCNASVGHTASSRHPPRSHTYNPCW